MTDERPPADTVQPPRRLPILARVAFLLVVVALVGGTVALTAIGHRREAPHTVCSLVGCTSAVAVEIDRTGLPAGAFKFAVCVGTQCHGGTAPETAGARAVCGDDATRPMSAVCLSTGGLERVLVDFQKSIIPGADNSLTVTVRVLTMSGSVLREHTISAIPERSQPNGPRCDPICYRVGLRESSAAVAQAPSSEVDPMR